jgi:hypothetical protein
MVIPVQTTGLESKKERKFPKEGDDICMKPKGITAAVCHPSLSKGGLVGATFQGQPWNITCQNPQKIC